MVCLELEFSYLNTVLMSDIGTKEEERGLESQSRTTGPGLDSAALFLSSA